MPLVSRINLPKDSWWEIVEKFGLPNELVSMLRGLVSATLNNGIPPTADDREIALAKKYLASGVIFDDKPYDVMVYKPENPETHRTFFVLVRKWLGGELKRLNEL